MTLFLSPAPFCVIGDDDVLRLKQAAIDSPLKRARICLHLNPEATLHEMLIAVREDSYVRPHRHHDRSESFHAIEGVFDVQFFDDNGRPTESLRMGPPGSGYKFAYRLHEARWHTVVPLGPVVIFLETTSGPLRPQTTEFAPWSPAADDVEAAQAFVLMLRCGAKEGHA